MYGVWPFFHFLFCYYVGDFIRAEANVLDTPFSCITAMTALTKGVTNAIEMIADTHLPSPYGRYGATPSPFVAQQLA